MAMEHLIQVAMPRAQALNLLQLLVISLFGGKEPDQLGLKLFIRMSGCCKQFSASRAQRLRHAAILMLIADKVHSLYRLFTTT